MYDTLPKSLKSEVLVKSKVEDPDKREERRKLTQVTIVIKQMPCSDSFSCISLNLEPWKEFRTFRGDLAF